MHRTTIVKYTKFSAEELQQSAADPLSCVIAVQSNEILSLRPRDSEHIVKGVKRCVMDKVGRYHSPVNGIVLGYAKVRIENALSALRLDSPFLHVRATIDYYVFQPRLGSTLRGTVNYVSKQFVSAMIYRVFNVTVKLTRNAGNRHNYVKKGSEIAFIVNSCDMKCEIPVIEGELIADPTVRIKQEPDTTIEDEGVEVPAESNEVSMETVPEIKQEPGTPKKTKKSKKNTQNNSDSAIVTNGHSTPPAEPADSDGETSRQLQSLLGNLFGNSSKKSSKKRKNKSNKSNKSAGDVMAVSIKQEPISIDDDPSSCTDHRLEDSLNGTQNGYDGLPNGNSTPLATGPEKVKKRKIQFNLSNILDVTDVHPTGSRKRIKEE